MASIYIPFPNKNLYSDVAELSRIIAVTVQRTIYINPEFAINGDGTTWTQATVANGPGAFNAWGTGTQFGAKPDMTHFWWAGTRYLQAAETEYSEKVTVYNSIGIVLGTYDPATGEQIQDNTRHAKLRNASGTALDFGTMGASRNNIIIDNFDIRATDRTNGTGSQFAISGSTTGPNPTVYVGVMIVRCITDGYKGLALSGSGILIKDSLLGAYRAPCEIQTVYSIVDSCTHMDTEIYPLHDAVALQCKTGWQADLLVVRNCDVRKSYPTEKQGIYVTTAGDLRNALVPLRGVIIEGNLVDNANQLIHNDFDNAIIRNNILSNATNPNSVDPLVDSTAWGIQTAGYGCTIEGNVIFDSPKSAGIGIIADVGSTTRVYNNNIRGCRAGISASSGTHTVIHKNNIYERCSQTGQDDIYMWFVNSGGSVTWEHAANNYYAPDGTDQSFNRSGVGTMTFATHKATYEATATDYDSSQWLDSAGRQLEGSPFMFSGVFVGNKYDPNGVPRWIPPSRGAYEYVEPRPSRL